MRKDPIFYKNVFFALYKKEAEKRGVKFERRNFRRIDTGFCFQYACQKEGKRPDLNAHFWWIYQDNVSFLAQQGSRLRESIRA